MFIDSSASHGDSLRSKERRTTGLLDIRESLRSFERSHRESTAFYKYLTPPG